MPLLWLSFTQLTNVSEIKSPCGPEDIEVNNGLSGEFEHGAFLSVGGQGVRHLKLESPVLRLITAVDPVTQLPAVSA